MRHLLPYLFLLLPTLTFSQGSWNPPGADLSFPRTLLKAADIPAVQARLSEPRMYALYSFLWNDAFNWPLPVAFTNDPTRRKAAYITKDIGFILLLDRKPAGGGLLDTLTNAERDTLFSRAVYLLDNMNNAVENFPTADPYLWRSNELTNFLCGYDLLLGAGFSPALLSTARSKLVTYATNLHAQATISFFGFSFFGNYQNNHGIRTASALALAGIVLNDHTSSDPNAQPNRWIQTGLWNVDNIMWQSGNRQSDTSGVAGYAEGPHYLRFGIKHFFVMARALHHFIPDGMLTVQYDVSTRTIRHPWHDAHYDLLWEWVMRIRMPDGRMPALEDSFVDLGFPEVALFEKPQFLAPLFYSRLHPLQTSNDRENLMSSTDDMIPDYLAALTDPAPMEGETFYANELSGDLVFRSGWDSNAVYLHANARNGRARVNAKGHNQGDASSFLLYYHGHVMALDPGYLKYDRRAEVGNAQNHNLVLVDGNGPLIGSVANANDEDAFLENAFTLPSADAATVRTRYGSVDDISRHFTFVRGSYFILCDDIEAGSYHQYEWLLQGAGLAGNSPAEGTFIDDLANNRATWQHDSVHFTTVIRSYLPVDSFTTSVRMHELVYDSAAPHTALSAHLLADDARYLVMMLPWVNDSPAVELTGIPGAAALLHRDGSFVDFALVQPDGQTTPLPALASGLANEMNITAGLLVWSEDTTGVFQFFRTVAALDLNAGGTQWMSNNVPMAMAWQKQDANTWVGACGDTGTSQLHIDFVPGAVLGAGVLSWSYNAAMQQVVIQFDGPGSFIVTTDSLLNVQPGVNAQPHWKVYPNPAQDFIQVNCQTEWQPHEWTLCTPNGAVMRRFPGSWKTLPLADVPAGIYILSAGELGGKWVLVDK